MALTREQFQELRNKGLSVDQIVSFESGKKPVDIKMQQQFNADTSGNQFEEEKPKSFLGKAKDFTVGLLGGGKLAEGIGKAFAAKGVREDIGSSQDAVYARQQQLVQELKQAVAEGRDTTQIKEQLQREGMNASALSDAQTDFADSMPTNKQVISSSARLATTALTPALSKASTGLTGLSKARTFTEGALRGGAAGALTGGLQGGIGGAGYAYEEGGNAAQVALAGGAGALGGALTGAALGAIGGGILGKIQGAKDPQTAVAHVTPRSSDLTPQSYQELLNRGRVEPKGLTHESRVLLSKAERATATKFKELMHKDPVTTVHNINNKLVDMDEEVGAFLKKNNFLISREQLKFALKARLDDIDDITLDAKRLGVAKDKLINNFVSSLEEDDVVSLWRARKSYDQLINKAFQGSPTTSKAVKIALRGAVQDFLKNHTPNNKYAQMMDDMSGLFDVRDLVGIIAKKQRGLSALNMWMKDHPAAAWVLGGTALGVGNALGLRALGGRDSSHD
jgi:hypothetical protein